MEVKAEYAKDELLESAWALWKKWSISICRMRGIDIRMHGLTLLGIFIAYMDLTLPKNDSSLRSFLLINAGLFISILVHEMGHTLTARFFRNAVKGIIIFPPLGGLAFIEIDKRRPFRNILIYLSGPAANIVLALALLYLYEYTNMKYYSLIYSELRLMTVINMVIGLLNLIPFYPLDGGRIFQNLILLFKSGERKANMITLCVSCVCFAAILMYTLIEKDYVDLTIAVLLMVVSFMVLMEKPAESKKAF